MGNGVLCPACIQLFLIEAYCFSVMAQAYTICTFHLQVPSCFVMAFNVSKYVTITIPFSLKTAET